MRKTVKNNTKIDLGEMGCKDVNRIELFQDGGLWYNGDELLSSITTVV
jgi:hypothetical protein